MPGVDGAAFRLPDPPARALRPIAAVLALAAPGLALSLFPLETSPPLDALAQGLAILAAALLLAWATEVAQIDLPQGAAFAILALVAVLPEYAVDFVLAWKAGRAPEVYAPLALANMTGANRILIGLGWSMVVLLAALASRRQGAVSHTRVTLHSEKRIEVAFLTLATAYSLTLPFRPALTWVDTVVLFSIFLLYVMRLAGTPVRQPVLLGPPRVLGAWPPGARRTATGLLFVLAAGILMASAEPFAESLIQTGERLGVDRFLLVQWVAPLASESAELIPVGLFAWRLRTEVALGTLISSKVNQWTLLVGSLPVVFALSSGTLTGLPLDPAQREEVLLTAAQSAFAVALLVNLELTLTESLALLGLFLLQFVLSLVLPEGAARQIERIGISVVYLALAAALLWSRWRALLTVVRDGVTTSVEELARRDAPRRDSRGAQGRSLSSGRASAGGAGRRADSGGCR